MALIYNGGYVDVESAIFEIDYNITFCHWVYLTAWNSGWTHGWAKDNDFGFRNSGYGFQPVAPNILRMDVRDTTPAWRIASWNGAVLNTWYHCLGLITDSTIKYYVDGNFISQDAAFNGHVLYEVGINILRFGRYDSDTTNVFKGCLEEAAIWDCILDDWEIQLLAKSMIKRMPLRIRPANLKGYWPMDDDNPGEAIVGAGADRMRDYSGNGKHGTYTGAINMASFGAGLSYPSRVINV